MAYIISLKYSNREPQFEFLDVPEKKFIFGFSLGLPVGTRRMPTRAKETSCKKSYPDIFAMPGLNAVSRRFRDLVEEFEPGVHQFFPLELYRKNGDPVEGEYFIFNCAVSFDCVLTAKTDVEWRKLNSQEEYPSLFIKNSRDQILSHPQIAGRHLWCGFRQKCVGVYVSDAFFSRLKKEKFNFFRSKECPEIDEPWVAEENLGPQLKYEKEHGLQKGMKPWLKENSDVLF